MTAGPRGRPERLPFFVYGTLRPGQRNHDWALRGRTVAEEPARLPGAALYRGPGYPYAVATPEDAGAEVRGELITPAPEHYAAVLATLDRLEGYAPGAADNDYERVVARVLRLAAAPAGAPARAWVYLAPGPSAARLRATGARIASGDWLHA